MYGFENNYIQTMEHVTVLLVLNQLKSVVYVKIALRIKM